MGYVIRRSSRRHLNNDIMILYIVLSYLLVIGMMIEYYNTVDEVTLKGWATLIFAPITFPIMIGMSLANMRS